MMSARRRRFGSDFLQNCRKEICKDVGKEFANTLALTLTDTFAVLLPSHRNGGTRFDAKHRADADADDFNFQETTWPHAGDERRFGLAMIFWVNAHGHVLGELHQNRFVLARIDQAAVFD